MKIEDAKKRNDVEPTLDKPGTIDIRPDNEYWDIFVDGNIKFIESLDDGEGSILRKIHEAGFNGGSVLGFNLCADEDRKIPFTLTNDKEIPSKGNITKALSIFNDNQNIYSAWKEFIISNEDFFNSLSKVELKHVSDVYKQGFSAGIHFGVRLNREKIDGYKLISPEEMIENFYKNNPQKAEKKKSEELKKTIYEDLKRTDRLPEGLTTIDSLYGARKVFSEIVKKGKSNSFVKEISDYYRQKGAYVSNIKDKTYWTISFEKLKREKKLEHIRERGM